MGCRSGALWDFKILACLFIVAIFSLGLFIVPLMWPLRLWRSAYVLTTQRLVVCQPALLVFCPRVREIGPAQVGRIQLKCIWTWLPQRTGDIIYGEGVSGVMERVPRAEEVVALIRNTLVQLPYHETEPVIPAPPI